jgi:hypothetical protein
MRVILYVLVCAVLGFVVGYAVLVKCVRLTGSDDADWLFTGLRPGTIILFGLPIVGAWAGWILARPRRSEAASEGECSATIRPPHEER